MAGGNVLGVGVGGSDLVRGGDLCKWLHVFEVFPPTNIKTTYGLLYPWSLRLWHRIIETLK